MNRGGDFWAMNKRNHFVESVDESGVFARKRRVLAARFGSVSLKVCVH